jgi:SAM-dependent methyltransferase
LAQTVVSGDWRDAADETYRQYQMYAAADGAEQKVAGEEGFQARSVVLAGRWRSLGVLGETGTLLDIGCGNGSFLRAFAAEFPAWTLSGSETTDREVAKLRAIPGFQAFYGADPDEIPDGFDAFSLVHVLEHLENPQAFLARVRQSVAPGGQLLVEVPAWRGNPFALMIADHASHFSMSTLEMVVSSAGWSSSVVTDQWVPKELSLVASSKVQPGQSPPPDAAAEARALIKAVAWLRQCRDQFLALTTRAESVGLFGSAIAATWLYQAAPDAVQFFVDEDTQRIGRSHLGRPILAPDQVPDGADVFVGVSPLLSSAIADRLSRPPCRYHAASPLEGLSE